MASEILSNITVRNADEFRLEIRWSYRSADRIEEGIYHLPRTQIVKDDDGYWMQYDRGFKTRLSTMIEGSVPIIYESLYTVLNFMLAHVVSVMDRIAYDKMIALLKRTGEEGYTKIIMDSRETTTNDRIYGLIEAADKCRDQIVLCLMGNPGIGKTEAVERFAKDHGRNVVHIIASQILPSEVSGMTMPNQETHTMDVFDHARLGHMRDGDILFFDELLKGQQQVLNACLTLIQERRLMSGKKLPDVLIIAAANPLQSPGQLPLEIRQRFMFVDVEWNKATWTDYMVGLGFDRRSLKNLAERLEIIQRNSNTRTDSARWNILTPRSATKLCLWLRASDMSDEVDSYINSEFGAEASSVILEAVKGTAHEDPQEQVASKIIELVSNASVEHPEELPVIKELRKNIIDKAEDIRSEGCTNMSALIDMLQKLPEWEEVKIALASTKMDSESMKVHENEW